MQVKLKSGHVQAFKKGKNFFEIRVLSPNERQLSVRLRGGEEVNLLIKKGEAFNPLRVCSKTGVNGWTYTEKANQRPTGCFECMKRRKWSWYENESFFWPRM